MGENYEQLKSQKPRDINYVCDKVDEIDTGVNVLRSRSRPFLYALLWYGLAYSVLNGLTVNETKRQLTEAQTEIQKVETKLDNIEKILIDLQQKDK